VTASVTSQPSRALAGRRPELPRRHLSRTGRRGIRIFGRTISVIVILVWSLFPLYWALNTSLTTLSGAESRPAHLVPAPVNISNYQQLFGVTGSQSGFAEQFGRSLLNAVIESGGAMAATIVIAVLGAYAFARMEFLFKRTIFISVLATLLLPAYATLIPLYRIMSGLGLVNTYLAVILVYTSGFLPLATWLLYNYFSSIPRSLGWPGASSQTMPATSRRPKGTRTSVPGASGDSLA